MRKLLPLCLAALALAAPGLAGADAPANKPRPLHFKKDLGIQDTAFGKLHLYEGLWPVHQVTPPYPHKAYVSHITGKVVMEVLINPDGTVADVKIRKSSGHEELDAAGIEGIKQWKYPASPDPEQRVNIEAYDFILDG